jgi:hypothetical protein
MSEMRIDGATIDDRRRMAVFDGERDSVTA